jgi:hypothetical protein
MDDPSGDATTKKITLDQISTAIGAQGADLANYFNTYITPGSGLNFSYSSGINTLTINSSGIISNPISISGADIISNIVSLTQAEYDALVSVNSNTLYVIV